MYGKVHESHRLAVAKVLPLLFYSNCRAWSFCLRFCIIRRFKCFFLFLSLSLSLSHRLLARSLILLSHHFTHYTMAFYWTLKIDFRQIQLITFMAAVQKRRHLYCLYFFFNFCSFRWFFYIITHTYCRRDFVARRMEQFMAIGLCAPISDWAIGMETCSRRRTIECCICKFEQLVQYLITSNRMMMVIKMMTNTKLHCNLNVH